MDISATCSLNEAPLLPGILLGDGLLKGGEQYDKSTNGNGKADSAER